MAWPRVVVRDKTVEIEHEGGRVVVDGSAHGLVVDAPVSGVWELGSSRAGVAEVESIVKDELVHRTLGAEQSRHLVDAVVASLGNAADAVGLRDPGVERLVEHIRPTPLLFSAPYLAASFVRKDAARFRACRIAIAHVEDDADNDGTPERVEFHVDKMARWRDLFASDGKARRALNVTLQEHGETASVYALWGLKNVALRGPVASALHLELLGALGQHPRHARMATHATLIEDAPVEELDDLTRRWTPNMLGLPDGVGNAHVLVEVMAAVPNARGFKHLRALIFAARSHWLTEPEPETPLAMPPIPLPEIDGVRFLSTYDALRAEGLLMNHCVATRCYEAVCGEAFLFHAGPDNAGATIQVGKDGVVVEARGPSNKDNPTVRRAARALAAWGRGFWAAQLGLDASVKQSDRIPLPPCTTPLRTVADCLPLYLRASSLLDDDGEVAAWFKTWVHKARCGEVLLVHRPDLERPAIFSEKRARWPIVVAIDRNGDVVADSSELLCDRRTASAPEDQRAALRA
jgi:hypothetical protein